jgi:hypothetical protein
MQSDTKPKFNKAMNLIRDYLNHTNSWEKIKEILYGPLFRPSSNTSFLNSYYKFLNWTYKWNSFIMDHVFNSWLKSSFCHHKTSMSIQLNSISDDNQN